MKKRMLALLLALVFCLSLLPLAGLASTEDGAEDGTASAEAEEAVPDESGEEAEEEIAEESDGQPEEEAPAEPDEMIEEEDAGAADEVTDEASGEASLTVASVGSAVAASEGETDASGTETADEGADAETEESYWLGFGYNHDNDGTNNVFIGGDTIDVEIELYHGYYDDNGDYQEETVSGFGYELDSFPSMKLNKSEESWTEDGCLILTFTSRSTADNLAFEIYVSVDDEVVASGIIWINVIAEDDGYYTVSGEVENVGVGHELDLNTVNYVLTYHTVSNTEEADISDFCVYLDTNNYDPNAWKYASGSSENNYLPTLVRTGNWWTNMQMIVDSDYDPDNGWVCECWIDFDYINYDTYLTVTYDEVETNVIFTGETVTVTWNENEDNDYPLTGDYRVEWEVYVYANGDNEWTLLENSEYTSQISYGSDGDVSIWLKSSAEGISIIPVAHVYYGENEISAADTWIEAAAEEESYDTNWEYNLALGEGAWFDSVNVYVRDRAHIDGEDIALSITGAEVTGNYDYDGNTAEDEVIRLDGNADDGWSIDTCNYGYATIEVTYKDLDDLEKTFSFNVYVYGSRTEVDVYFQDGENTDWQLVGAERTVEVTFRVIETQYDDNGNYWPEATEYTSEELAEASYTLFIVDGSYDAEVIAPTVTENGYVVVKGLANGSTNLEIAILDSKNNECGRGSIWINVTTDGYYTITGAVDNVGLGNTVDLSAIDYVLTYYYVDENGNPCSQFVDISDYNVYLDTSTYNKNAWEYADVSSTEHAALPTLVRTGYWWTDMRIIVDDNNDPDDDWICDYWPSFDYISYDTYLTATYDDMEFYKIYTGETVTVTLNEEDYNEFALPEDCQVDWDVYVYDDESDAADENGWVKVDGSNYNITWEADGSTLYLTTYESGINIIPVARVTYTGEEISYADTWLWSISSEIYGVGIEDTDGTILPSESVEVVAYLVEFSSANPNGTVTELEIVSVEVITNQTWGDNGVPYDVEIGEKPIVSIEGATVTGLTDGRVQLKITYKDKNDVEQTYSMADDESWLYVMSDYYYIDNEIYYYVTVGEAISINDITLHHKTYDYDTQTASDVEVDYDAVRVDSYDSDLIDLSFEGNIPQVTGLALGGSDLHITVFDENKNALAEVWSYVFVSRKSAEITGETEQTADLADGSSFDLGMELAAGDGALQYEVLSGEGVASVDENGKVTLLTTGEAVIRVYVEETDAYYAAECEVTLTVLCSHSYTITASQAATDETDGYVTYTCQCCGDSYTEVIPATGVVEEPEPTATTAPTQAPTTTTEPTETTSPTQEPTTTISPTYSPSDSYAENISVEALTEVPEGLTGIYSSVEELTETMITNVVASATGYTEENAAVYEVKLLISTDGGETWIEATEENFPTTGITVTLPYPDGTDSSYDFVAEHMFTLTSERLGTTAGDTENPTVTKTADGLRMTLTGLSPVAIAWKEGTSATAAAATATTDASPKTGDDAHAALWLAVAVTCACGLAVTVVVKKKKGEA